jgi:ribosomal-protein-alanine N-acetyltransferase
VSGALRFIEAASAADLDDLLELEAACSPHPWSGTHFRQAFSDDGLTRVLVARECAPRRSTRATLLAFCVVQVVAGEAQVHNLAVSPSARRAGLGRLLLRTALRVAAARGATLSFLEVRASNAPALRLYESLGFVRSGRRRDYYRQPTEDAILMSRGLDRMCEGREQSGKDGGTHAAADGAAAAAGSKGARQT